MPKDSNWITVRIYPDGTCARPNWQGDCTLIKDAKAVPVQPHGRLIDADKKEKQLSEMKVEGDTNLAAVGFATVVIRNAPTIIPAEEEANK